MVIRFDYDESTAEGTITLEGNLTIDNMKEIRITFIDALSKTDNLLLDHNGADEYDISYLQFLLSMMRTSVLLHKKFAIKDGSPEKFNSLVRQAGFDNINFLNHKAVWE